MLAHNVPFCTYMTFLTMTYNSHIIWPHLPLQMSSHNSLLVQDTLATLAFLMFLKQDVSYIRTFALFFRLSLSFPWLITWLALCLLSLNTTSSKAWLYCSQSSPNHFLSISSFLLIASITIKTDSIHLVAFWLCPPGYKLNQTRPHLSYRCIPGI